MPRISRLLSLAFGAVLFSHVALGATDAAPPSNSNMDASLFYQLLVGEMSARSGDDGTAYSVLLDAARKTQDPRLYERAVEVALHARNGEAALEAAQAWARVHPSSTKANIYQFQILLGLNRVDKTPEPLQRELAALDVNARKELIAQLPRYMARVSDKTQAAEALERGLASELTNADTGATAWTTLGVMRWQADNLRGAFDAVQRARALDPQAQEPVLLALELMGPKVPEAEPLVQEYLQHTPKADVRMGYARRLLDAQHYADAYQQLLRVTEEKPELPEGWLVRGSLELQDNKLDAAEASLQRYLTLQGAMTQPTDRMGRGTVQALLLLSQVAENRGQLDQAAAYLDRIDSTEEPLRIQRRRAAILARQGKLDAARALLREVPETQAGDALAKVNAEAQLLRDNQKFRQAYQLLKESMARFPDDMDLVYDVAMMAERLDKLEEMETLLKQVIAARPQNASAYNALGYALADRKMRLDEARQYLQKALEFAPQDPYIIDSMGWLEFRMGNSTEALRLLQSAYQARPDAEIAAHLGEVLWTLGQHEQAQAIWKEGLAVSPQNDTLNQTIQRLRKRP